MNRPTLPDARVAREIHAYARFHGYTTVFVDVRIDVRIDAHGELTGGHLHHGLGDNLGSFVITVAGRVAR
ncbi:hypothetical protein [Nonomuraea sp. NPDC046570]|uniref:hypothetical protein n=1 Tax=Nonomuraea sp. NPDC046570 TaxID=3155255 RepID=UPI0033C639E5